MSFTVEQIRSEALRLSPEERAQLVGELIDSLDELTEVDQDAAWRAEVRRRVQGSREGKVDSLNGDEVMQKLRQRFKH